MPLRAAAIAYAARHDMLRKIAATRRDAPSAPRHDATLMLIICCATLTLADTLADATPIRHAFAAFRHAKRRLFS